MKAHQRDFTVAFDKSKVNVEEMLAALKAAGESAKAKG